MMMMKVNILYFQIRKIRKFSMMHLNSISRYAFNRMQLKDDDEEDSRVEELGDEDEEDDEEEDGVNEAFIAVSEVTQTCSYGARVNIK
jgi:Ran GTPase-activating protein (RanGAP) involved in mRNA processing and transport